MQVISDYTLCPNAAQHCVVALGNFDGVHLGHQKVIEHVLTIARKENKPSAVLTFEPHPINVLRPDTEPFRLGTLATKINYIEALGIDYLFVVNFTSDFSKFSAHDFVHEVLINHLQVSHVITGHNFIFGHQRSGNAQLLEKMAHSNEFNYTMVEPVGNNQTVYSSTLIREYLAKGNLEKAIQILGHPYQIIGLVQTGDQRGRELGCPTANIDLGDLLRPAYGVYAATVQIDGWGTIYKSVANIGIRPSVDSPKEWLEVHLFDYEGDLYQHELHVDLIHFLRHEKKFTSLDALKTAIERDCKLALDLLS